MGEIGLKAGNDTERALLAYLEANAGEALREKIAAGKKTLSGAWAYVESQARKELGGKSGHVADATVFGWVVHYFEEEQVGKGDGAEKKKGLTRQARTESAEEAEGDGDRDGAEGAEGLDASSPCGDGDAGKDEAPGLFEGVSLFGGAE